MQASGARNSIRTMHASFVIMFLLMFIIFGLGAFETAAAIINPKASVLLPFIERQTKPQATTPTTITVLQPTTVFSAVMDPLRSATPGEVYDVVAAEPGWVLVVRQGDPPDRAVWIQMDARIRTPGMLDPIDEDIIAVAAYLSAILLALLAYFGIRRRVVARRIGRGARRRKGALPAVDRRGDPSPAA